MQLMTVMNRYAGVGKKEAQQMEQLVSQKIDQYRYGAGGGSSR